MWRTRMLPELPNKKSAISKEEHDTVTDLTKKVPSPDPTICGKAVTSPFFLPYFRQLGKLHDQH